MKARVQKWKDPTTLEEVEAGDDVEHAPDEYVNQFFALTIGDVVFVEIISPEDVWRVWRVECIIALGGGRLYATRAVSEIDAHEELGTVVP